MAPPYQMPLPLSEAGCDQAPAEHEACFDPLKFMNLVGSAVPMDEVDRLQEHFGTDLVGAVDEYHNLKNKSATPNQDVETKGSEPQAQCDEYGRKPICYRDEYWDKATRKWTTKRTAKVFSLSKYNRYIISVKRIFSEKMVCVETKVDVKGPILRNALRNIFRGCAGFALTDENTEVPDCFFFWAKPELELLAHDLKDKGNHHALFEIDAALQFIQEQWSATMPGLDAILRHRDGVGCKSITFHHLWAILPPDVLVLGKGSFGEFRVYCVREHGLVRDQNRQLFRQLIAEYVDYDGNQIGLARERLKIPEFNGAERIDDLPYAPLHLHSRSRSIRNEILRRNKKQLDYCTGEFRLQAHTGHGLAEMKDERGYPILKTFNFHGRVIIDPAILERVHPRNIIVPGLRNFRQSGRVHATGLGTTIDSSDVVTRILAPATATLTKDKIGDDSDYQFPDGDDDDDINARAVSAEDLTIDEMLMLSGMLYGWSLGDARWGAFSVTRVSEVEWDDGIFHSLVIEPNMKTLMFELIKAHAAGESGFDDFVRGKGKGLIGLLHGEPGLGKTLTAEAIAEAAHMPLCTVSSGELGSDASSLHRNLTRILELTTHWKAVLLLDEADVFLAQRNTESIQRNAMISVFLRELEFYPGILILTTNQANIIDPAFRSRIHFCHQYSKLDLNSRAEIWRHFIRRVRESKAVEVLADDAGVAQLAKMNLNGRQIKNVVSIAVKLATRSEHRCVSTESFFVAAKPLQNFNAIGTAGHEIGNHTAAPRKPPVPAKPKLKVDDTNGVDLRSLTTH